MRAVRFRKVKEKERGINATHTSGHTRVRQIISANQKAIGMRALSPRPTCRWTITALASSHNSVYPLYIGRAEPSLLGQKGVKREREGSRKEWVRGREPSLL